MARIDVLPSIDIIRGFKGVLDFYLWRGLPCVRAWPTWRPTRQTEPSKAAAVLFGAVITAFSLIHGTVLEQLAIEATGIPRTTRDIYVSGVFGNLHEASMSDFLDLLTQCRDSLAALAPLADALLSINTDQLLVRGQDQLFSFQDVLAVEYDTAISGDDGYVESPDPLSADIWAVTHIRAVNKTTETTRHDYYQRHDAWNFPLDSQIAAFAPTHSSTWNGLVFLDHQDTILVYFKGGLAGDLVRITLSGYRMTRET